MGHGITYVKVGKSGHRAEVGELPVWMMFAEARWLRVRSRHCDCCRCHQIAKAGERVLWHVRTGVTMCESCARKSAAECGLPPP